MGRAPDAVDLLAALLAAAGSPPLRVIGAYSDSETPARLGISGPTWPGHRW